MSWLAILALAAFGFVFAVFALKLPRASWTLFAAALLFGLAGYATQGAPEQPAAPKEGQILDPQSGEAMVEARKEYVQAARLIRVKAWRIMLHHILPNCMTPIMVAATLNFGLAILSEATLSFLGVGMPPDQPSLGTLIRIGNQYLFSGLWWIVVFPSIQLCLIVLSVNMIGDWLRDALNPKLR